MRIKDITQPIGPCKCLYNIPYDNDYSIIGNNLMNNSNEYVDTSHKYIDMSDIPNQHNLSKSSKLCGYIEIDGTYHKCESCEHETIIRHIIWENDDYRKRYFSLPASFYDSMPRGMLQEEYFAMKELGFVKISSFKNTPNDMVVFFYNNLTYKQSDIIYPR